MVFRQVSLYKHYWDTTKWYPRIQVVSKTGFTVTYCHLILKETNSLLRPLFCGPEVVAIDRLLTVLKYIAHTCTVKPVYNGHCISRSPLNNSQVTESQMGLQCAFQPALTGHLSITARLLSPKWVYSVHFNLL